MRWRFIAPWTRVGVLAVLVVLSRWVTASYAYGQSAQEPLDVSPQEVISVRGLVPYQSGGGSERAARGFDSSTWPTRSIPGMYALDDVSARWVRVHLRNGSTWHNGLGISLPAIYGSWELWFNGTRVAQSGQGGGAAGMARELRQVVTIDRHLVRLQSNVLALRLQSWEGLEGLGGEVRIGDPDILRADLEKQRGLSLGLALAFLLLGLFAAVLAISDRERLPVLFAATMIALSLMATSTSDWWYLFFDDTGTKIHLRVALFFLMHAGGLFLVEQLFVGSADRGARIGALLAVALGAATVALPLDVLFGAYSLSWTLTCASILYVIYLGKDLPVRSPVVRAGVRAGFAGLFLAVLFEVFFGLWVLPEPGPFEGVFVVLILTLVGLFAIMQARARGRAMSVLQSSVDGLAVLDLAGRVVYPNPALLSMLGVSPGMLDRIALDERFCLEDRGRLEAMVESLAATEVGAQARSMGAVLQGVNSNPVSVDVLGIRLDDMHVLLSLRDVTERSRLEKEVARAQRLDSLGMLAGGIAHDFNNLLAGILIASTELEQDPSAPPDVAQGARSIAESARRGGALTHRLLQFARGRVSPTVGVDLESELPDMLDMLGRTLGRNLDWSIEIESNLPSVQLDEAELEQILVNLCVNARDAMAPRGGQISVQAMTARRAGETFVKLRISDDGRGMTPDLLARVIEPFVTTKGSGAGTGLGLAVVHGIVTARDGEMTLDSSPGQGTQVTLYLPIRKQRPKTLEPSPSAAPEPVALAGRSVLLVEDEPSLRRFIAQALERRGLDVEVLANGGAVMPWIDAHLGGRPPVDAVIMDMMMPVMDGLEATNALREAWPRLPVVISSGYTGRESIEPLIETGPTLLLEKPYQVDELIEALSRVIG